MCCEAEWLRGVVYKWHNTNVIDSNPKKKVRGGSYYFVFCLLPMPLSLSLEALVGRQRVRRALVSRPTMRRATPGFRWRAWRRRTGRGLAWDQARICGSSEVVGVDILRIGRVVSR